jgi:hypothetical protein
MTVKKKFSLMLVGVALVATPCFAGLFDDVYFAQLIQQGVQMIRNGEQAVANIKGAAQFIAHPAGWRQAIDTATVALDQVSTGSDSVALQRLNRALGASQQVYRQISNEPPTLANIAALSSLSLQQVEAKNQADQLAAQLQSEQRVRQFGTGYGNVSAGIWREAK